MRAFQNNGHLRARDFRRCLVAGNASASGTVVSAANIDAGQVFTFSAFVYITNLSPANLIINCIGVGGYRFNINTSGGLTLNTGTDNVNTPNNIVPLYRWCHVAVTFAANRDTRFYIDGELVHAATMTGTSTWVNTNVMTTSINTGGRICYFKIWKDRVLTQDEIRSECYDFSSITPTYNWTYAEGVGTATVQDAIGLGTATLSNMLWTEQVPTRPTKVATPIGYSQRADYTTNPYYAQITIPSPLMTSLRSTGLTMAHWIKIAAFPGSSFRSMSLYHSDGATVGPSIRFDCGTPGFIYATHNGRPNTLAGSSTLSPAVNTFNLLNQIGKWMHVAVTYDYVNNRVDFYINGIRAYFHTSAGLDPLGFHSDAVSGSEIMLIGVVNSSATMVTFQTDHLISNAVATADQIRRLHLYGTAPPNTIFRMTYPEGAGSTSTDIAGNNTMTLTRVGTPITTAWSADVP